SFPTRRSSDLQAVALRPLAGRSTDAALLHVLVDGREPGEEAERLFALAEDVQGVPQSGEPLAQPLDLACEQLILALDRATLGDVDAARQRGAAEDEEQQREQSADTDECL